MLGAIIGDIVDSRFEWNNFKSKDPKSYNSYGNKTAMRVSACGFAVKSINNASEGCNRG